MYCVVRATLTITEPDAARAPRSLSMKTVLAFDTLHESVVEPPATSRSGEAVRLMTGGCVPRQTFDGTTTLMGFESVDPFPFVARTKYEMLVPAVTFELSSKLSCEAGMFVPLSEMGAPFR
jgi:hypothetical protein